MKHARWITAGIIAALTVASATTVFAADDTTAAANDSTQAKQESAAPEKVDAPDMSGLELPEGFVAFDKDHVPDGKNAPEKGELKAIEFDENGNMVAGQAPEMNGERPELPDGVSAPDMSGLELPEGFVAFDKDHVPDGKNAPEKGELKAIEFDENGNMVAGQAPEMNDERPELPDGVTPPEMNGERPELPNGVTAPEMNGERPELPDGVTPPEMNGERPELPDGVTAPEMNGERPELPADAISSATNDGQSNQTDAEQTF